VDTHELLAPLLPAGGLAVQPDGARLVRAGVVPVAAVHRLPVRRPLRPAEPGTSGWRWRKIGVPY